VENGLAIFLSTAPSLFEPTIAGLVASGLANERSRIGLEKPLGIDLPSSKVVNDAVAGAFTEDRIFRIDHYLGKETVQNLLALRFANIMFEPLWNATHIEHVQITVAETVGLEGRVGFYDGAGALRDMVQNHMLQLLALVAMEPPARFDPVDSRREDQGAQLAAQGHAGRYRHRPVCGGRHRGRQRAGLYRRAAEAFGDGNLRRHQGLHRQLALEGRALLPAHRQAPAQAHHRDRRAVPPVPHSMFAQRGAVAKPNRLIIGIQPEENITLDLMTKVPGLDRGGIRLREVPLDIRMPDAFAGPTKRIAYERLLLDLIEGDQTLFVRRDEVEAQWTWMDGIRACWTDNEITPSPIRRAAGAPPPPSRSPRRTA
jgi:glucose-6-phosphate 1-dehydrogenase